MKFLTIAFLLSFASFAQSKQGSITYEMFLDLNNWRTNGEQNPETTKLLKDIEKVSFTLL